MPTILRNSLLIITYQLLLNFINLFFLCTLIEIHVINVGIIIDIEVIIRINNNFRWIGILLMAIDIILLINRLLVLDLFDHW